MNICPTSMVVKDKRFVGLIDDFDSWAMDFDLSDLERFDSGEMMAHEANGTDRATTTSWTKALR